MKPIIPVMRTALEQIQEVHCPDQVLTGWTADGEAAPEWVCKHCTTIAEPGTYFTYPCATRKLADAGLVGGERG